MFKQWIEERKRQGPDSQQMQGNGNKSLGTSQNIQSLLRKQSLAPVESLQDDQSTPSQTNSSQLNQVVAQKATEQTRNANITQRIKRPTIHKSVILNTVQRCAEILSYSNFV